LQRLVGGYEFRAYWFEIFECARKVALVGLSVFFEPASVAQFVYLALICFLSFGIYVAIAPYSHFSDDLLAQLCQFSIFVTLMAGLVFTQIPADDPFHEAMGYVATVFNLLPSALAVGMLLRISPNAIFGCLLRSVQRRRSKNREGATRSVVSKACVNCEKGEEQASGEPSAATSRQAAAVTSLQSAGRGMASRKKCSAAAGLPSKTRGGGHDSGAEHHKAHAHESTLQPSAADERPRHGGGTPRTECAATGFELPSRQAPLHSGQVATAAHGGEVAIKLEHVQVCQPIRRPESTGMWDCEPARQPIVRAADTRPPAQHQEEDILALDLDATCRAEAAGEVGGQQEPIAHQMLVSHSKSQLIAEVLAAEELETVKAMVASMGGPGAARNTVTKGLIESVVSSCMRRQRRELETCSHDELVSRLVAVWQKQAEATRSSEREARASWKKARRLSVTFGSAK